jgi:hypothetical protein
VNPSFTHAERIATFKRAQADAAHKFGLIHAAGDVAAKAAKRRDTYAKKRDTLG